jgi:biopolymer transport protein ExbD
MRLRRHRLEPIESSHGIDLAPMLDFVLNLLLFFIITAVFVKQSGLLVNRPSGAVIPASAGEGSVPIRILANGEIWLEHRLIDVRALRANAERLSAVNPGSGVLIVADGDAPSGRVVEVIDQLHLGGIYDITFSTAD